VGSILGGWRPSGAALPAGCRRPAGGVMGGGGGVFLGGLGQVSVCGVKGRLTGKGHWVCLGGGYRDR
jgi:hypothetical protein